VVLAALALALAAAYGLWLRDSSLVRIERVEVRGLTVPEAPRLRARVAAAARRMTTLNVRLAPLERALRRHPALQRVEADPRLPDALEVTVTEYRPVARLRAGGRDGPPVAADGTLLRALEVKRPLPVVETGEPLPARARALRDRRARRLLRAIAAAPGPLGERLGSGAEERGRGVVLRMRRGPEVVMGTLARLDAKWAAAARVLADPGARGAAYVDVRLPGRPVAGGLPDGAGEASGPGPAAERQSGTAAWSAGEGTRTGGDALAAPSNPQP
jgi:cell division protein FtsQ